VVQSILPPASQVEMFSILCRKQVHGAREALERGGSSSGMQESTKGAILGAVHRQSRGLGAHGAAGVLGKAGLGHLSASTNSHLINITTEF